MELATSQYSPQMLTNLDPLLVTNVGGCMGDKMEPFLEKSFFDLGVPQFELMQPGWPKYRLIAFGS